MNEQAPIAGVIQGDLPGQIALREWVERRQAYWANPPYGPCTTKGCPNGMAGASVLLGDEDPRCGDCRRAGVDRRANGDYPCDRCSSRGAFRDPLGRHDAYLCGSCHKDDGYEPTERAMVSKVQSRVGFTHSLGRRPVCKLRDVGTACGGEVKQRASFGEICNRHWNPKKYDANKGS